MAYLYLVRHARSSGNHDHRLIGRQGDYVLTDTGRQQATLLVERLTGVGIDTLHSSPLTRARQTAEELRAVSPGLDVVTNPDLTERDFGPFDGMDRPTLLQARRQLGLDNRDATGYFPTSLDGVEPFSSVTDRLQRTLQQLNLDPASERSVAFVSHAGAIKAFLYRVLSIPENHPRAFKIWQASFVKFKIVTSDRLTVHEIWTNPLQ